MLNLHIFRVCEIRAQARYVNERQNALCVSGSVSSALRSAVTSAHAAGKIQLSSPFLLPCALGTKLTEKGKNVQVFCTKLY